LFQPEAVQGAGWGLPVHRAQILAGLVAVDGEVLAALAEQQLLGKDQPGELATILTQNLMEPEVEVGAAGAALVVQPVTRRQTPQMAEMGRQTQSPVLP
jgi:hypothetical protein